MAMTASEMQTSPVATEPPEKPPMPDGTVRRKKWPRRDSLLTGTKAIVGILGLLGLWELAVVITRPPEYILVGPLAAFAELFDRFDYFTTNAWVTVGEALAGFVGGTLLGVICGALLHYSPTIRTFLYPALVTIDTIPKVALAPLFIVWFGFGFESKAFVAMAIAFFPLVINTFDGLSTVPHELKELARINRASTWKRLTKIEFIYALPSIFSGAKISISLAVGGAVVGEFIAGSKGLGYVIMLANSQVDLAAMFAAFFVLAAIALVLFFIVDFTGKKLMPWKSHAK
ncbi:nitrate ABC transporter permease [Rhodococcus sp. 05-2256-B2]|nr:nitrate ABC transporter permease [Rhodococcus sp. 05-2256-B4]OZD89882.1 nitrate ABC transporter permease [Rhodococcus sp. 05-2256-B2]OZD92200.1 nitrate ABC transporter permease [Rhodococcus sp. 05-2256-B3]OZD98905.1 nitrate ABC transporter permease [Rhodococcus sp. 05-2256-B1]